MQTTAAANAWNQVQSAVIVGPTYSSTTAPTTAEQVRELTINIVVNDIHKKELCKECFCTTNKGMLQSFHGDCK